MGIDCMRPLWGAGCLRGGGGNGKSHGQEHNDYWTFITDEKLKNNAVSLNNVSKHVGNSIGVQDNRDIIENDLLPTKKHILEDDTVSIASLGSHKHRKLRSHSGSHKGSTETLGDGEEKRDTSKEDLEGGKELVLLNLNVACYYNLSAI